MSQTARPIDVMSSKFIGIPTVANNIVKIFPFAVVGTMFPYPKNE